MFCKYCGNKVDSDALYCSKCGKKLKTDDKLEHEAGIENVFSKKILLIALGVIVCAFVGLYTILGMNSNEILLSKGTNFEDLQWGATPKQILEVFPNSTRDRYFKNRIYVNLIDNDFCGVKAKQEIILKLEKEKLDSIVYTFPIFNNELEAIINYGRLLDAVNNRLGKPDIETTAKKTTSASTVIETATWRKSNQSLSLKFYDSSKNGIEEYRLLVEIKKIK